MFLCNGGSGLLQGLPYLLLEDFSVCPAHIQHTVTKVPATGIRRQGGHVAYALRDLVVLVGWLIIWIRLQHPCIRIGQEGMPLAEGHTSCSLLFSPPHDVGQEPVQQDRVGCKHSPAAWMVTSKLGHHRHVERVPVAKKFLLHCETKPGCPEGSAVFHPAYITHWARIYVRSVSYLIHLGLLGGCNSAVKEKLGVGTRSFDYYHCRSGHSLLAWLKVSH